MEVWITGGVICVMFGILVTEYCDPLKTFTLAMIVFVCLGFINMEEAVAGFSNTGVLAVGALFILAGAVEQSDLFKRWTSFERLQRDTFRPGRMFMVVTGLSAFLNNTPIVSIFIPIVKQIAGKTGINASKLLIPISYLSMLGGVLTLVGTSTNLVVSGLMMELGLKGLSFFELTGVAFPSVVVGFIYILLGHKRLLPDTEEVAMGEATEEKVEQKPGDTPLGSHHMSDSTRQTKKAMHEHMQEWHPMIALCGTVLLTMLFNINILEAALIGIGFLLLTDTIQVKESLQMVEFKTICLIAVSFSIGKVLINTGTASFVATLLSPYVSQMHPFVLLILVFIMTNMFTIVITNNAAAILAVPLVYEIASLTSYDIRPLMMMTAISASFSFLSPFGYQTNTMVYHAGGYRFKDFIIFGLPLSVLMILTSATTIYLYYYR